MLHQNQLSWYGVTSLSSQSMCVQGWSSCQVLLFMPGPFVVSGLDGFDELDQVAGVVAQEEYLDVLVDAQVPDDVGAEPAQPLGNASMSSTS